MTNQLFNGFIESTIAILHLLYKKSHGRNHHLIQPIHFLPCPNEKIMTI